MQPCEKPMRTQRRESNPCASSKAARCALTTSDAARTPSSLAGSGSRSRAALLPARFAEEVGDALADH